MKQSETDLKEELQLELNFTFQAPIDLVFETLTMPEHLKNWHSPDHLNITFTEADLKVDGEYRIGVTLAGGDGKEMLFVGRYLKIKRPNLLVYTQAFSPGGDEPLTTETKITIHLEQEGNQTFMNFKQTGFSHKQALQGARMSWPQAYDKLGEYLIKLQERD